MIPGTFEVLVKSWSPKQGLCRWRNKNGFVVLQAHYSADPNKTHEWAKEAARQYGGMESKIWKAEQEIDWLARSGGRVFETFDRTTHVVKDFAIPADWKIYRGVDYGLRNPTACVWVAVDGDQNLYVFKEYKQAGLSPSQHAQRMKGMTGQFKIEFSVLDPSAFQQTQQGVRSIADQFAKEGLYFVPGNNKVLDGITALQELFLVHETGKPRLTIFESCKEIIDELLGYRWQVQVIGGMNQRDPKEAPVKENDHLIDALRYIVMSCPQAVVQVGARNPAEKELTVHERVQREVARRHLERILARQEML